MNKKSMIDVAYEVIEEEYRAFSFKELYDKVTTILEFDDETKTRNIGIFYTQLTVDGRFLCLTNNTWDLKDRHSYAASHDESAKEAYGAIEEEHSEKTEEDAQEEKEYNAAIEGKNDDVIPEKDETESEDAPTEGDDEEEGPSLDTKDILKSI